MLVPLLTLLVSGGKLSGPEAQKTFMQYEQDLYNSMMKSGGFKSAEFAKQAKKKANELLKGENPNTMALTDVTDWANMFSYAGRNKDAKTLLTRYIKTNPNATDLNKVEINLAEVNLSDNNFKGAEDVVLNIKPSSANEFSQLGSIDSSIAQSLQASQGNPAALDFINKAAPTLSDPAAKRGLSMLNAVKAQITLPGSPEVEMSPMSDKYGTFSNLAALKGNVVVLDFFAHWCGPCKASMPDMRKMTDDLGSKGLDVVGVTSYYGFFGKDQKLTKPQEFADMKGFMQQYQIDHPVVYVNHDDMMKYGVTGIPEFVLIDRQGVVRKIQIGYDASSFAAFRKEVEKAVADHS